MPGENLSQSLRSLRESRHVSQRALAEQTGFSASFLSQVENGQTSPSLSSMERIATALGVTLAQFFDNTQRAQGSVVRRGRGDRMNLEWSQAEIESAGSLDGGSQLYGIMGEVVLTLDETEHLLASGDSAVIPAGVKRRWRNETPQAAQILIVSAKSVP
jgi:transcriptional regulator with XRE-family HTH domain